MSDGFLQGAESTPVTPPTPEIPAGETELTPNQADHLAIEQSAEAKDTFLEQAAEDVPVTPIAPAGAAPVADTKPAIIEDEVMVEVEKILEEGLGDYVATLPEEAKERFLAKGRDVASELSGMVRVFKVEVRRTLQLIRDWLLTIPGVNKFFLEQEVKIKTDRILGLSQQRKEESQPKI